MLGSLATSAALNSAGRACNSSRISFSAANAAFSSIGVVPSKGCFGLDASTSTALNSAGGASNSSRILSSAANAAFSLIGVVTSNGCLGLEALSWTLETMSWATLSPYSSPR